MRTATKKKPESHNVSTARNQSQRRRGQPIDIPRNNPIMTPSNPTGSVKKIKLMKTRDNSSFRNTHIDTIDNGDRSRSSKQNRFDPSYISSKPKSLRPSTITKRRSGDIIEISDSEEHNTPKRRRRLIKKDDDSEDDEESNMFKVTMGKNSNSPASDHELEKVCEKMKRDRRESEIARTRCKEEVRDTRYDTLLTIVKRKSIDNERRKIEKEDDLLEVKKQFLHDICPPEVNDLTDIPEVPTDDDDGPLSITESAAKVTPSLRPTLNKPPTRIQRQPGSSSFVKPIFNNPFMTLADTFKDSIAYLKNKSPFPDPEIQPIFSQPKVGDIFDMVETDSDFVKPTIRTVKKKVEKPVEKEEEVKKVEVPYDPIDDEPLHPIGSDQHLLTYPFQAKKSVTVYQRDIARLDDGEYLNDTLLDIFPKIWEDECQSDQIHTFSSFFYTKLAGDGSSVNYDKIGRWTANVNIFKKRIVIIPVAQHHHWYLIVVTNPARCLKNPEELGLVKASDYDHDFVEQERPPRVGRWKNQVPAGAELNPNKSYIMVLDSLGGTKKETCKNITEYLKAEAMQKLGIEEDGFVEPEFVSAHCPTQKNFVDCGVFCLHYINSIYQNIDRMIKVLYNHRRDDEEWDLENTIPIYRHLLRRILKKRMTKYRDYLKLKIAAESSKS